VEGLRRNPGPLLGCCSQRLQRARRPQRVAISVVYLDEALFDGLLGYQPSAIQD